MRILTGFYTLAIIATISFTTTEAVANSKQPHCREFTQDIVIDGETVAGFGKACLQQDGTWKIVSTAKEKEHIAAGSKKKVVSKKRAYRKKPHHYSGYRYYKKPHRYYGYKRHHRGYGYKSRKYAGRFGYSHRFGRY